MSACVVWLDHQEATLFFLSAEGTQKKHFKKHTHPHSNSHADARHDQEDEKFYHLLATQVGNPNELLILGPGLAKNHFKTHLEKHHHAALAKKVVGVESTDHPTDNQVLAQARKFFKAFDTFN
jgi:stalled ribosome rescue protein Dom34